MKNKEDLSQLIKSLSKSEKRYFTLDAQKAGSGFHRLVGRYTFVLVIERIAAQH